VPCFLDVWNCPESCIHYFSLIYRKYAIKLVSKTFMTRATCRVIAGNLKLGGYEQMFGGCGGGVNLREAQIYIKNIKKHKQL